MNLIKSDIIKAFIVGVPISVMILFIWIAFKSHGIFEIDMTHYGEYEIEMGILFLWFILSSVMLIKHLRTKK